VYKRGAIHQHSRSLVPELEHGNEKNQSLVMWVWWNGGWRFSYPSYGLLVAIMLLVTLLPIRGANGAISYVQGVGAFSQYYGSGPSSVVIPVTASVAAGNSIIVTLTWGAWGPGEITTCSDTQGNSYTTDVSEFYSGAGLYTIICSSHNVTALSASDTINVSFTSSTYGVAATAHEFSGLAPSLALDQTAKANGSSTTPSSGNTATTIQADELLIGAIGVSGSPTDAFTPGGGYTALNTVGFTGVWNGTIRPEYKVVSATGVYQADGVLGVSAGWSATIATYKAAASTVNITTSGTLYSDEGITPLSGQTVRLLIEGNSAGTAITDGSGNYSITAAVTAGDMYIPLLVYVDDGTVVGTTVTVLDSTIATTINDLDIYADHLITRQDGGGTPLDTGDMDNAKVLYPDTDILYSISWPDMTVTGSNTELYVAGGHFFTPFGNVTTPNMKIVGTLNAGDSTYMNASDRVFAVSGNWDHSFGTFNHGTSTVDFTGTGTIRVTGAWWTKPFYNVTAAAAGQTTTIAYGSGIAVTNVLTLGSGTLAGGEINLSLDSGTPLVTGGTTFTNTRVKYHPNSGGPINVAAAAYRDVWLAGNAATNTFNLMGDMSCATLTVAGSGGGDSAVFDTAGHAISCNNLAIGTTNVDRYGTLRLNGSTVDVSGNVTIYASDTGGTNQIDAGSATINVGGNWTNSDTFSYGTSTVNFTGSGTIDNGTSWSSVSRHFYNVSGAAAGQTTTISSAGGMAVENVLSLGAGTLAGGKVYLRKDGGAPLVLAGTTLSNSLFRYIPLTAPVDVASATYPVLYLVARGVSATFSLLGDIGCNTLWVLGNSTGTKSILDTTGNSYSITCNQLRVGNSSNTGRNGELRLNGSAVDINGNLFIQDGLGNNVIDAGSATINVSGDWNNSDTFTAGTSSVILDGTGQALNGSTTFYNLTKTVSSADTLTFAAGSTQTITGTATLQGTSGQLLSLRSSATPSRWNLNLASGASKAISYVDVQDGDASGSDAALLPVNPPYSVDSGNNVSWFGSAVITVTKSSTVISDPVNGATNPKRIPGAVVEYTVTITNSGDTLATGVTLTDDLSGEAATVSFVADSYGAGSGIRVTAPNINGGSALALTNAVDADQGDYGGTAADTVTVGGIALGAGEQATVKFRVVIQ